MSMTARRFAMVVLAFSSLGPGVLWAAALKAGAAKATITPDVKATKVYMAGFDNNRVATGVHDDLYVRCLALGAGQQTLALCEADVIGLFYDDVLKVREKVKAQAPEVTEVIVASSHDHEGPDTLGLWGPTPLESGMDEKYMDWLDDRITSTALQAVHSMQDARMTLARDDHPLLAMLQSDSRPPYVKDPYLFVMQLTSAGRRPSHCHAGELERPPGNAGWPQYADYRRFPSLALPIRGEPRRRHGRVLSGLNWRPALDPR